jgi:glycosyltransferase involved in cell wall biosynthesis
MRIARILTRLNLGGPARQVLASDPELVRRGHVLRIFAGESGPGEGDLLPALRERGLDVVPVPGLRRAPTPGDLLVLRRLRRELRGFAPDVLHTHASKAGVLGRRAARGRALAACARVHTFHGHVLEGYFPPLLSRRLTALERRLARETDRIVAVAHATAEDLLRLGVCEEQRLVVVPPGIELEPLLSIERGAARPAPGPLRRLLGAGPEQVLFGVIGRLAEVKRPLEALGVFALLAARHPRLELVFVGDGPERRGLERAIAGLGPEAGRRVHLLGARPDVPELLAELDGVLLCSRAEGLPVSLIEAAAASLPVVASDVGGVGELVVHERTGYLGRGVEELAYGLARLLDDPAAARAMGARARLRVAARYSAAALADRLEELYRLVQRERAGGPP